MANLSSTDFLSYPECLSVFMFCHCNRYKIDILISISLIVRKTEKLALNFFLNFCDFEE